MYIYTFKYTCMPHLALSFWIYLPIPEPLKNRKAKHQMQLSIFSSGVNRILQIPICPIRIFNLFNIFLLIIIIIIISTPTIEGVDSNFSEQQQHIPNSATKKLQKLPHVFNTVLELPFHSDADHVAVEEKEEFFRFVAKIEQEGTNNEQVRAQAVEIYPGITKIVVSKGSGDGEDEIKVLLEQLNVDTWRYRLPASTMPELATAAFLDGELIVTVPKGGRGHGEF